MRRHFSKFWWFIYEYWWHCSNFRLLIIRDRSQNKISQHWSLHRNSSSSYSFFCCSFVYVICEILFKDKLGIYLTLVCWSRKSVDKINRPTCHERVSFQGGSLMVWANIFTEVREEGNSALNVHTGTEKIFCKKLFSHFTGDSFTLIYILFLKYL